MVDFKPYIQSLLGGLVVLSVSTKTIDTLLTNTSNYGIKPE